MNGIMALKRGGKGNKKTAKEKKVATARYKKVKKAGEAARAEYNRDRARSNQGNKENKKETTTVLSPLEALIANKDKLVKQDAGDGVRNQYQVQMDNYKKGLGAYEGMDPKKNKAVFKERFPNPLIKIARGIGDVYSRFSPMANIARALNEGNEKVKNFGPVKDASTMIKDLSKIFGLDSLKSKLVNIAGGKDTNDFNKVIQNNQTSTAMRNNLAYGDPLGLNKKFPVYNDPIMNMGYVPQRTTFTDADEIFDTDNFSYDADEVNVSSFPTLNDKIDYLTKSDNPLVQGKDVSNMSPSTINKVYEHVQSDEQQSINLSGDPDEIFEDVSETTYVSPNERIRQNYEQEFLDTFGTPMMGDYWATMDDGTKIYGIGDRSTRERFALDNNIPLDQIGEFYPKVKEYPVRDNEGVAQNAYYTDTGDFSNPGYFGYDYGIDDDIIFSDVVSDTPALGKEIRTFPQFQADGGYMSNFPNQNMGTQSLTASDNIDDRIMKNLQFEKMAPGMMGYNQGGKVMSTYDKLKAIADNNYG